MFRIIKIMSASAQISDLQSLLGVHESKYDGFKPSIVWREKKLCENFHILDGKKQDFFLHKKTIETAIPIIEMRLNFDKLRSRKI